MTLLTLLLLGQVAAAMPALPAPVTLWTPTQSPTVPNYAGGATPYELGMVIRSDVSGTIVGIKFWKSTSDPSIRHTGRIWSVTGQLLASTTFTDETTSGWQQQPLTPPLVILANMLYVVSVPTGPNKAFAVSPDVFTATVTNGHLTAPINAGRYGLSDVFPATSTPNHYFRDVIFAPDPAATPTQMPPMQAAPEPTPLLSAQLQLLDLRMQLYAAQQVARSCAEEARIVAEVNNLQVQKMFSRAFYDSWIKDYEAANPGWTWDMTERRGILKPVVVPPKP